MIPRDYREVLKDTAFWGALGTMVAAVAAVAALGLSVWQLRMAYQEAREQRADADEKRVADERMMKAMSTPYLAFNRNYTGIEVHVEDGRLSHPRRKDPNDPVSTLLVKNYGSGPALNCKMTFHTTAINAVSVGPENSKFKLKEPQVTEAWVEPRNIMPGHEASVKGWPSCFDEPWPNKDDPKTDYGDQINDAMGYVVFTCETLDGTKHEFKETFDMTQGAGAKPHPLLKVHTWGKESPLSQLEERAIQIGKAADAK